MESALYIFGGLIVCITCLTLIYGTIASINRRRKADLAVEVQGCFVISVGNLVMGGSGKTPFVLALTELLSKNGIRVAIASRGYKGLWENTGGVVSDGQKLLTDAAGAGDEPFMMAQELLSSSVSVVVGADRYSAINQLREVPEVLILDDGFQHTKLKRDLDIVLLPVRKPLWRNLLPLPVGVLREFAGTVQLADLSFITKSESYSQEYRQRFKDAWLKRGAQELEVLFTTPKAVINSCEKGQVLEPCQVQLFSALADNQLFRITIESMGFSVAEHFKKQDHDKFTPEEIETFLVNNKFPLVTTRKDFVKLALDMPHDILQQIWILEIQADLASIPGFVTGLDHRLRKKLAKGIG